MRVPSIEAGEGYGNGTDEQVRIADRFALEDELRRIWLKARCEKASPKGRGGPCRYCGRPLSTKNATGSCATCNEHLRTRGTPGMPKERRAPFHRRQRP